MLKLVRTDFWENPGSDWICLANLSHGMLTVHMFESVSLFNDVFRIMRCPHCGLIDPCGVPLDYLELAQLPHDPL
jgi:hypothetical protein